MGTAPAGRAAPGHDRARDLPLEHRDRRRSARTLQPDLLAALERCERLVDVPLPVDLRAGEVVALRGDIGVATAVARSLVVQLAGLYGPADWRLVVVTDRPAEWDWVDWLPQAQSGEGVVPSDEVARLADRDPPRDRSVGPATVVVTDVPVCSTHAPARSADCSPRRTGCASSSRRRSLRRRCAGGYSTSERPVRHGGAMARRRGGRRHADIEVGGHFASDGRVEAARRLAPLVDPEAGDVSSMLPAEIRLGDLEATPRVAAGAATVVRRGDHMAMTHR